MSMTAITGPLIVCRENPLDSITGAPVSVSANQNPDIGPSLFSHGMGLLDPRPVYTYITGEANGLVSFNASGVAVNASPVVGWLNARFQVADYAPGSASTTILAPVAYQTASATITLTASSVVNNTYSVTTNSSCTNAFTGVTASGLWLIDALPAFTYSSTQIKSVGLWDVTAPPIGRAVSLYSGGNLSSYTFYVSGYDAYGFPITSSVTGPNAGVTTTLKTFKWVSSVTASTTFATTACSVGVADVYGLPFYASAVGYLDMWWNNTNIATSATALSSFIAGVATTASTSGDVRGTINPQVVSDGSKKMQLWQSISTANITSTTGLFGVTPY
jgi:hypothetical protein